MQKVSERYPAFKDGWIVIDVTDAPRLANAIGSRIYRRRSVAVGAAEVARRFLGVERMRHVQVVPVEGKSEHFALDYLDASDVMVRPDGQIRMAR